MNCLIQALALCCRENLLAEKWLVAPSLRVGQQWLESVARNGQPVVNVQLKTLTSLAIELAAPQLASAGVTMVSARGGEFLVDQILHDLQPGKLAYLSQAESNGGLATAVFQTLNALRLAAVQSADIDLVRLEVAAKKQDLVTLLKAYEQELNARRLIDTADLLRMAADRLRHGPDLLADEILLLVPADLETHLLERELLRGFPAGQQCLLPVDELATTKRSATSDLELLRWLNNSAEAPPPVGDQTVRIRRAVGEVNEVREVLRACVAEQVRFDEVELLHPDSETYVPLIYETFCTLAREDQTLGDTLPVTFAEGITCSLQNAPCESSVP